MSGRFVEHESGEVWWVDDEKLQMQPAKGGLDARYYEKAREKIGMGSIVTRHPSSQKFHDLCDAMKAMHDKKQQDYGRENDPFANVRSTEEWGQPAWVGAMIRATDKLRRLQKAAAGGTMANESVEDSFIDLAVYTIIGLVLYREGNDPDRRGA